MTDHPLRKWRLAQADPDGGKITLTRLAEWVGVAQSHLSQIETRVGTPSLDLAAKLSRLTKIPLEAFVRKDVA